MNNNNQHNDLIIAIVLNNRAMGFRTIVNYIQIKLFIKNNLGYNTYIGVNKLRLLLLLN